MPRHLPTLALVVALGAGPFLPGVSAATDTRAPAPRTFVLERTTTGPASFRLIVDTSLSDAAPDSFVGQVSGLVRDGRLVEAASLGAQSTHFNEGVVVRAADRTVEVCQPLGGCIVNRTLATQSATFSSDAGGPDAHNRLYVVLEGPAEVRFDADGWVLRDRPLEYSYLRSKEADTAGVFTGVQGVHLFRGAELTGRARGSVATATPPCSAAGVGVGPAFVPRGAGTATLSGGRQTQSLTCPLNLGKPFLTDVADGSADWRLDGPVVGENTQAGVPLFVLAAPGDPDDEAKADW